MAIASQMSAEKKSTTSQSDIVVHEWESYPLNLLGQYDVAEIDLGAYNDRLCKDISRLVGDCTEIEALTVKHSIDPSGAGPSQDITSIENLPALEDFLMKGTESTSTFFSIRPPFSFAELLISEKVLKKLLSHFEVYPGFLDILHTFGEKIQEEDEDFLIYRQHITKGTQLQAGKSRASSFEICYNLKYVQLRQDLSHPERSTWAMRKMGVHSKYYPLSRSTTWILLQSSENFSRRLEEVVAADASSDSKKRRHDFEIHLLAFQSACQSWTPYINHLEKDFKQKATKAFVEFDDARQIQGLKDKLLQLSHALEINSGLIASLRRGLRSFQREWPKIYGSETEFHRCDLVLEDLSFQTNQHKNRVESLIRRTDGLFTLIPYMFAQRENSIILKLSEKGTQYARSMKVITIFTMIYLPPSFVASFFGIQLFSWNSDGEVKLAFEVIYYFLATIILMALTFGIWWWWERRSTKKTRSNSYDEEKLC